MLGVLGLYASPPSSFSGLSSIAAGSAGAYVAAAATYLEESGEALAGVTAVLIGVAPRLVLPAEWTLRRTADAQKLGAPAADARQRPVQG